jgi:predicted MPP superfamily phosphohydrolase
MATFFLIYFSIYGSMHVYFFLKVHLAFSLNGYRLAAAIAFLLLMLNAPILVRLIERAGFITPATWLAYLSYIWMAVLLWFVSIGLVGDIWNFIIWIASRVIPAAGRLLVAPGTTVKATFLIIALVSFWGILEASRIRVESVVLSTPLLEPGSGSVTVAQISDLHLGLIVGEKKVKRIKQLLDDIAPDILVSTGDMVDGTAPHLDHMGALFDSIKPPLGKFAVTGNHEYYAGLEESLDFHRRAGFTVLRGESTSAGRIRIVGVDDPAGNRRGERVASNENSALPPPGKSEFTLLLKHRPQVLPSSLGRFDLQLSGHTHRGQIFPFNYLVKLQYPMLDGLYPLGGSSVLYTSRGTGTWGPPMRVLSPPEITVFTIVPEGG